MEKADRCASVSVRAGGGDWGRASPKSKIRRRRSPKPSGTGHVLRSRARSKPVPFARGPRRGDSKRCLFAPVGISPPTGRDKLFHRENPGEIARHPDRKNGTGLQSLPRGVPVGFVPTCVRDGRHSLPYRTAGRAGRDTLIHRGNPEKYPPSPRPSPIRKADGRGGRWGGPGMTIPAGDEKRIPGAAGQVVPPGPSKVVPPGRVSHN
jgi:hypothetical protein